MGKKNYLTYVRDTYGGSWPRTLVAMSLLVIWTHATTRFLFDVEWFEARLLEDEKPLDFEGADDCGDACKI